MITERIWKNLGAAMVALMVLGGSAGNVAIVNASDCEEDFSKYTPQQRKLVEMCKKNKRGDNVVNFFDHGSNVSGDFSVSIATSGAGAIKFFHPQTIRYALETVEFEDYPQLIEVPTIPEGADVAEKRRWRDSIKQIEKRNHSLQTMIDRERGTRENFRRIVRNIVPFLGNAIGSLRNIGEQERNGLLQKLVTGNGISSIECGDFMKLPVADLNRLKASLADNWCRLAELVIAENPELRHAE